MTAYYNENDPFAAAWLRELIKAELIAPGEVDERSIEEVKPDDLRGFIQCHFFAGIGCWSYALRLAGWPDDESIWTGSCPCPPFSSAGTKKACPQCGGTNPVPHVGRTGFFVCCLCDHEWFADARHLWPELWRLISVGRPVKFFGEQVASVDGRTWLASVRASLEILEYAVGAADLCSAGVGSPDIRQRLYFVADTPSGRQQVAIQQSADRDQATRIGETALTGTARTASKLGITESNGRIGRSNHSDGGRRDRSSGSPSAVSVVDKPHSTGPQQGRETSAIVGHGSPVEPTGGVNELGDSTIQRKRPLNRESREGPRQEVATRGSSVSGELAQPDSVESGNGQLQRGGRLLQPSENPLTGFWSNAEWIYCQDGKYRPVEPGSFPLAHGATNRVGRLRGYGNAINAEVAKAFIEAYMSI